MANNNVNVKATAYSIKGSKGSISFKWKSNTIIDPGNEKILVANLETIIGEELIKQQL